MSHAQHRNVHIGLLCALHSLKYSSLSYPATLSRRKLPNESPSLNQHPLSRSSCLHRRILLHVNLRHQFPFSASTLVGVKTLAKPKSSKPTKRKTFTMNDQHIAIMSRLNPNPYTERNFVVKFFDLRVRTTVTSTPSVVRKWVYRILNRHRFLRGKLVVGLGVQWRPSYSTTSPPLATLQLCIGSRCLIFQLLHANSVPLVLRRFLDDRSNTFVGVWNHNDVAMLRRSKHRLSVSRVIDMRHVAAERRGLSVNLSMEKLAGIFFGADVRKPQWIARSWWDAYWLKRCQIQYACVDALISFLLGKNLEAWNWNRN